MALSSTSVKRVIIPLMVEARASSAGMWVRAYRVGRRVRELLIAQWRAGGWMTTG